MEIKIDNAHMTFLGPVPINVRLEHSYHQVFKLKILSRNEWLARGSRDVLEHKSPRKSIRPPVPYLSKEIHV